MVRGNNRQVIFYDEDDRQKYLEKLERAKKRSGCEVYGYCLMGNHVHLLIKESKEDIGNIMKRIGASYAMWYNLKYKRVGHVFQDRYKSECVEDDSYLLAVVRYIHHNPQKAGLVKKPEDYRWSSCNVYYGKKEFPPNLTNTDLVLGLFSGDEEARKQQFQEFVEQDNDDQFLEDQWHEKANDEDVRKAIERLLKGAPISSLQGMERNQRDQILHQIKEIEGSTIRQIARIIGIGYNIIIRA